MHRWKLHGLAALAALALVTAACDQQPVTTPDIDVPDMTSPSPDTDASPGLSPDESPDTDASPDESLEDSPEASPSP